MMYRGIAVRGTLNAMLPRTQSNSSEVQTVLRPLAQFLSPRFTRFGRTLSVLTTSA
jgi:hypothetical protein